MSEFTIENIINYCSVMCEKEGVQGRVNESDYKFHDAVREYMYDLQRYKDLEEQGRLIITEVAIGQTVWVINKFPRYKKDKWIMVNQLVTTKARNRYDAVCFSNKVGDTVFLTKEEAEAKLKELQND